jgi:hypothetical protein
VAATKAQRIPAGLRERVAPTPFALYVDHRLLSLVFMLGLSGLIGFGRADGYGLVYLLGPPVSMLIGVVACTALPFRPYRGGAPFTKHQPVDSNDPAAMRLVELFKSGEVRAELWRAAAKLTGWLLLASLALAALRHRPLNWRIPPADQIGNVVASAIFSWVALGVEYVGWGLRTWAEREMSEHGGE